MGPEIKTERNENTGLNRFFPCFDFASISPRKQLNYKYCGWVYDYITSVLSAQDEDNRIECTCTVHAVSLFSFTSIAFAIDGKKLL